MFKWLRNVLLFLLFLVLLFSLPPVQTSLAKLVTNRVNNDFGTDLVIKRVDLSFLGSVSLKGIQIRDHHKDTLIFVDKLSTSLINAKRILDNKVELGSISLQGVNFHLTTYPKEQDDNLSVFIDSFEEEPEDSTSSGFVLKTSNIYLEDFTFRQTNLDKSKIPEFSASNMGGNIQDFKIEGPDVTAKIRGLYFKDNRGLEITNLTTDFMYTKKYMEFYNLQLQTNSSDVRGNVKLSYKREDLQYFNDRVTITGSFNNSKLAVKDLKKLYSELSGQDILSFSGKINGKLNDFTAQNFFLKSKDGIEIDGRMEFKNIINSERGFIFSGNFTRATATYNQLKSILPNVLGNTLPSEFQRLGRFSIRGETYITPTSIDADVEINSQIGSAVTDLQIVYKDDIDNARYKGTVRLNQFDIGVFFNDPLFGKMSFQGDVNGSGFTIDNIDTSLIGDVSLLEFKEYTYQNIQVNGQYKKKLFDGFLAIDDANLKMDFKGLADLSSKIRQFDFTADIKYANLLETNLFTRDSISEIKGKINFDIEGNTLDNIVGKADFKNVIYTNQKQEYAFNEFLVTSSIKDSIKTIKIESEDIARGELKGKFTFDEVIPVAQNALGSIYTNYRPHKVNPGQFLDFNFTIYDKIVDVFYPDIDIDSRTKIKGAIRSNKNQLKLTISSPSITVFGNEIKDLLLRTDNQNTLYNTHLMARNIKTEHYDISKLNLLNRTINDTLFFKSEFKGGVNDKENFNLDFYYTINKNKKSVLGIQKSTLNFKDRRWNVNPENNKDNKIVFDLEASEYRFDPFRLESGEQKIAFKGVLKDSTYKSLKADFTKVQLESFLPPIDSLSLKGKLSGEVEFLQEEGIYKPKGTLVVNDFAINAIEQGDLAVNVVGEDSYEKYLVNLSLQRDEAKSVAANGSLDFSQERPIIDLSVYLEKFQLKAFSPLGNDVLSNIRGSASGNFSLKGFLRNPDMDGILTLSRAGLKFPYLNTDYDFEGDAVISLNDQSFYLDDIQLKDTKHNTQGILSGNISHLNFESWFLNLNLSSNNLLVLDTKDSEEALYYGTAFIDGNANIYGLTNNITIEVNAKTNPNTTFVIPLKDIASVEQYHLIHFKSEKTIAERQKEIALESIEGVTLNINLEVTKDAVAQVVIDEVNGSDLKGSGTGNLRIEIDTRGKFNMFGDYMIDNGFYNLKYGGIINKPFAIQKGGTISWNGNPFEANLNVTAVYSTNANPAVLLDNISTNRKIPVNLVTNISGGLFNSKQEFDIQIPNANSTVASELDFVLNDNDENTKMRQFFSLLAFGNFINPNGGNFNSNSVITTTGSNVIGSILSDLISSEDGKIQLGVNYTAADESNVDNLNTDETFDVSVRTQISDRVVINGLVGVPVGAKTQSSVVGEVKVEVLLNEEGNFRGIIFNRQNEIQYSAQEEGYTQGVGLSYQVNFNTLSDLLRKAGLKKGKKATEKEKDSILSRHKELINFKKN